MARKWSKTTKRMIIIAAAIALMIIISIVVLSVDFDRDGLPNYQELSLGTGILTADTDNDGLGDGSEVDVYQTNPLVADTDNDSLQDGLEVNTYETNPLDADSDADSLSDGQEVITYQTNPLVADTDNDSLQDGLEVNTLKTNPNSPDTDSDSLWDGEEVAIWGTDPLSISLQPLITVVSNKTGISAILIFETKDSKSCRVKYGTDANYGRERTEVQAGTEHLIIFTDLIPNLEYRYTIGTSYNGRDAYSKDRTFTSRNAVNNWDNGLQNYTANLFVYFNFDANQDNFDTWESYLEEAAEWIYDATDGYIRLGTVVMADSPSPEGDLADFDNVTDMKIGFFPGRGGYNATGGDYYGIGRPNIFMELGIYGDYYYNDWTDSTGASWAPPTIAHEFGHYALGLRDEYYVEPDGTPRFFCDRPEYNSSLMSVLGYWPGYDSTGNLLPFEYYSELCTDAIHTPRTNWEPLYIGDSMWRILDSFYPNIPDNYYTGSATPIQDVGPGWDDALSFIIVNF
jgi:hypothetical protein